MTPEPKDVQFARVIVNTLSENSEVCRQAIATIEAHEANIDRGRQQAEERQRAIDETTRRWPELGTLGCTMEESEYLFTVSGGGLPTVVIDKEDGEIDRYCCAESGPIQSAVALALIDAAGRNTTAERLRDAIGQALELLDSGDTPGGRGMLSRALEAETWNR